MKKPRELVQTFLEFYCGHKREYALIPARNKTISTHKPRDYL